MSRQIAVCSRRHHRAIVPLVPTMAFNGAEYWCALCGATYGLMGVDRTASTEALQRRLASLEAFSGAFLRARACRVASQVKHEGHWIPPSALPAAVQEANAAAIAAWTYSDPAP